MDVVTIMEEEECGVCYDDPLNNPANGELRQFIRENPGFCRCVILCEENGILSSMDYPDEPMGPGRIALVVYSEKTLRVDHVYYDCRERFVKVFLSFFPFHHPFLGKRDLMDFVCAQKNSRMECQGICLTPIRSHP